MPTGPGVTPFGVRAAAGLAAALWMAWRSTWAAPPAAPDSVRLDFDAAGYRANRFPGYCVTYAVFRNDQKRRPLFAVGRGAGGAFLPVFDFAGLADRIEPQAAEGEGRLLLDTFCCLRAPDWDDYACGAWVRADPHPALDIVLANLRDWKALDALLKEFLNLNRRRSVLGDVPPEPRFASKVDVTLRVGSRSASVRGAACELRFVDLEKKACWGVKFRVTGVFAGADLGLADKDAGPVHFLLVTEAFAQPPGHMRAPTPGGKAEPGLPTRD